MKNNQPQRLRAFTLVEMLVVMAIIALLLAALLPAIGAVKNRAKIAATSANFGALNTGIESYRGEQSLGSGLPPSSSDYKDKPQEIAIPTGTGDSSTVRVAGAHLLAMAMIGADALGTPGFKDIDNDGTWWDNTHKDKTGGIYYVDETTGKEKYTRYGPYVDEKMRDRAKSLKDLADKGVILNADPGQPLFRGETGAALLTFLDDWDHPILYYKASPATNRMVSDAGNNKPGIFRQEDNGVITGTAEGQTQADGLDFGAGKEKDKGGGGTAVYHFLASAKGPDPTDKVTDILEKPEWQDTFARFILDPKTKARPTPVQKDSYLLISAGPDGRYGTADDITNWTREQN